jgi:hypothetical protein
MRVIQGLLLFAFIPLVLFLFLRQPLGAGPSVVVGAIIMFSHRFLAAPWMARHATERCLWCGRAIASGGPITVTASGRAWTLAVCGPTHRSLAARFLTFVANARAPIAIGIFVPLVLLLGSSLAAAAGRPIFAHEWNAWQFRVIVAFTVFCSSFAYRTVRIPSGTLAFPFPLHNFFLLGIRNTLWVFRVVGLWWLVDGAISLARAFAGA